MNALLLSPWEELRIIAAYERRDLAASALAEAGITHETRIVGDIVAIVANGPRREVDRCLAIAFHGTLSGLDITYR